MNKSYEVVDIYREIGREFRAMGAEKVILIHSQTNPKDTTRMCLEIAVEGWADKEKLQKRSRELWPFLTMEILMIEEISDHALVSEIMEDGIFI